MPFKNPFEYSAANNLSPNEILDFYIEDCNFSRFIQSTKNVFLLGERGSGKTMSLLFNSFRVQFENFKRNKEESCYEKIGIYIPCNTPLFHKREYLLLGDDFRKSVICEHLLVLSIVYALVDTLEYDSRISTYFEKNKDNIFDEITYVLSMELEKPYSNILGALKRYIKKEIIATQQNINSFKSDTFYNSAHTFSSLVIPILDIFKEIPYLSNSHFLFMFDDAQDMNEFQVKSLNSWISYRDHSNFSFKVATTKINRPTFITATGGCILEGHDFISIDMEKPFQNKESEFYRMAERIIIKRLNNVGITETLPSQFFPVNKDFRKDMDDCAELAKLQILKKNPNATQKQVSDYVYKYSRAIYFKERPPTANLPKYTGFETIVDISTGVIRNLLEPCYWMYDAQLEKNNGLPVEYISGTIQDRIIQERSNNYWNILKNGLDKIIDNCSSLQSIQIFNLFEHLMTLFQTRLKSDISEPRAITFSISSDHDPDKKDEIIELINIARKAQLLYVRTSSSKERGKQDYYYVPNRILLPLKGLDPHGQYARVSIKLNDIWASAINNIPLPSTVNNDVARDNNQQLLDI